MKKRKKLLSLVLTLAFAVATLALTASSASGQGPYGGTPWAISGQIEAEDYDTGGEGVAYHDADSGNIGGEYRSDDVDLAACEDTGGGYLVGWINYGGSGEWLEYTVDVASTDTYTLEARVAGWENGKYFHIEFDGVDKTGQINVPNTGDYQNFTTVTVNNVSLSAGQQIMRIFMDTDLFNLNWVKFTIP